VDVVEVQPVQTINLDEELGIPAPETAEIAENMQKTPEEGDRN